MSPANARPFSRERRSPKSDHSPSSAARRLQRLLASRFIAPRRQHPLAGSSSRIACILAGTVEQAGTRDDLPNNCRKSAVRRKCTVRRPRQRIHGRRCGNETQRLPHSKGSSKASRVHVSSWPVWLTSSVHQRSLTIAAAAVWCNACWAALQSGLAHARYFISLLPLR
jgi:hypothetical protein